MSTGNLNSLIDTSCGKLTLVTGNYGRSLWKMDSLSKQGKRLITCQVDKMMRVIETLSNKEYETGVLLGRSTKITVNQCRLGKISDGQRVTDDGRRTDTSYCEIEIEMKNMWL